MPGRPPCQAGGDRPSLSTSDSHTLVILAERCRLEGARLLGSNWGAQEPHGLPWPQGYTAGPQHSCRWYWRKPNSACPLRTVPCWSPGVPQLGSDCKHPEFMQTPLTGNADPAGKVA